MQIIYDWPQSTAMALVIQGQGPPISKRNRDIGFNVKALPVKVSAVFISI